MVYIPMTCLYCAVSDKVDFHSCKLLSVLVGPVKRTKCWLLFKSTAVETILRTQYCAHRCCLPEHQALSQPQHRILYLATPAWTVSPYNRWWTGCLLSSCFSVSLFVFLTHCILMLFTDVAMHRSSPQTKRRDIGLAVTHRSVRMTAVTHLPHLES